MCRSYCSFSFHTLIHMGDIKTLYHTQATFSLRILSYSWYRFCHSFSCHFSVCVPFVAFMVLVVFHFFFFLFGCCACEYCCNCPLVMHPKKPTSTSYKCSTTSKWAGVNNSESKPTHISATPTFPYFLITSPLQTKNASLVKAN